MPPCSKTNLTEPGIKETGDDYVLGLNESVTMDTNTTVTDSYDEAGAMQFIIVTVSVYSFLGVFFLLVIRFRQGTSSHKSARSQADAINNYLKVERTLKLEGYKMKMLNEIEKHVESINNFEQRMKLLKIEQDIKSKDFGLHDNSKSKHGRNKKAGKKKHFQTESRRHIPGKRRLSAPDAFGRIGFSMLFMESKEDTIREEAEEPGGHEIIEEKPQRDNVQNPVPVIYAKSDKPETVPETVPETDLEPPEIQYIDT